MHTFLHRAIPICLVLLSCTHTLGQDAPSRRRAALDVRLFIGDEQRAVTVPAATEDYPNWRHRIYIESYRAVGHRDPAWNELVEQALRMDADTAAYLRCCHWEERVAAYDAAIELGCRDPLVLDRRAQIFAQGSGADRTERRTLHTESAIRMAQSRYPAYLKARSYIRAAQFQPPTHGGFSRVQGANMAILLDGVLALLPSILADDVLPPRAIADLAGGFAYAYSVRYGNKLAGFKRFDEISSGLYPESSPVPYLVRANFYQGFAWESRGNNWAFIVSDDNWELYREGIEEAAEALLKAWELDNSDPEVAVRLQRIYAQRCSPEAEVWHQKALALDPANFRTRAAKLNFLQRRWCGSEEELVAFGHECFASGLWERRVPFLLVAAHCYAALWPDSPDRRVYLSRPDVWADIRMVYDTWFERTPDAAWDRSELARLAYDAGFYAEAYEQLQILGDRVSKRSFGGPAAFDRALQRIEMELGLRERTSDFTIAGVQSAIQTGDVYAVEAWLDAGGDPNALDDRDDPLLVRAIRTRNHAIVEMLLQRGADPNAPASNGDPILFRAIESLDRSNVVLLLDAGARATTWNKSKEANPLFVAINRRQPDVIELLLEYGARLETGDRRRNSALNHAAARGYPEIVELLVDHGAKLETRNSWQYTPLMTAAAGRKPSVVSRLIALGAEVDATTRIETTALTIAAYRGHADIVELLLDAGADINRVNTRTGRTPLMYAAEGGHASAVEVLLNRGADRTVVDRDRKSAASIARERDHPEIAAMIERDGSRP